MIRPQPRIREATGILHCDSGDIPHKISPWENSQDSMVDKFCKELGQVLHLFHFSDVGIFSLSQPVFVGAQDEAFLTKPASKEDETDNNTISLSYSL